MSTGTASIDGNLAEAHGAGTRDRLRLFAKVAHDARPDVVGRYALNRRVQGLAAGDHGQPATAVAEHALDLAATVDAGMPLGKRWR